MTLNEAANGTVTGSLKEGQPSLNTEWKSGLHNGSSVTIDLHPYDWRSDLILVGTLNGARIDGNVNHWYSKQENKNECTFFMIRS